MTAFVSKTAQEFCINLRVFNNYSIRSQGSRAVWINDGVSEVVVSKYHFYHDPLQT